MRKIPTLFDRDWNGDRSRVLNVVNGPAQWVFDGEGVATHKLDGTCCMVRDGKLFKRREVRQEDIASGKAPSGFDAIDTDVVTGKVVGWVSVGDGNEDRWYREAFDREPEWANGTYELVGPKVQGNPEGIDTHRLVRHGSATLIIRTEPPRTFEGIRDYLNGRDIEGIVYHHPDGRMAKIKGRDFGFKRPPPPTGGGKL